MGSTLAMPVPLGGAGCSRVRLVALGQALVLAAQVQQFTAGERAVENAPAAPGASTPREMPTVPLCPLAGCGSVCAQHF